MYGASGNGWFPLWNVRRNLYDRQVPAACHAPVGGGSDCVRPDGVLCETEARKQILVPGTSVICALGQRARSEVADALRDSAPFVRIIGDAHRVSTITNAVYEGYHAALDI